MKLLFAFIAGFLFSINVQADTVLVAVAANFTAAMKEIATEFQQSSSHRLILSFASSGKIYAQIKNGAPFEVFLSADQSKPIALEKAGMTVEGSRFTYASGSLVLWSTQAGFIAADKPCVLENGQFIYLAIANPKLAPYGAAAVETLQSLQLHNQLRSKLVRGENIAQVYQYIASGNAQLGFVALSQVMSQGKLKTGSGWIVPQSLHQAIRQDAVLLNKGKHNLAAIALLDYLKSDKAVTIMQKYGYQ